MGQMYVSRNRTVITTKSLQKVDEYFNTTSFNLLRISLLTDLSENVIRSHLKRRFPGKNLREVNDGRSYKFRKKAVELCQTCGMSVEEASNITGVEPREIHQFMNELKAIEMYESNRYSYAQIQQETGISKFIISRHLKMKVWQYP